MVHDNQTKPAKSRSTLAVLWILVRCSALPLNILVGRSNWACTGWLPAWRKVVPVLAPVQSNRDSGWGRWWVGALGHGVGCAGAKLNY